MSFRPEFAPPRKVENALMRFRKDKVPIVVTSEEQLTDAEKIYLQQMRSELALLDGRNGRG